jgi:hypothetical protein
VKENNFSSDVAKMEGFLSTTHKLTPQLKGEKCGKKKKKKKKKKKNSTCSMRPTSILKKKEKRKKRKKEKEEGSTANPRFAVQSQPMAGLDLAGH